MYNPAVMRSTLPALISLLVMLVLVAVIGRAQPGEPQPWTLELGVGLEFFTQGPSEIAISLSAQRGGWGLDLGLGWTLTQSPEWRFSLSEQLQLGSWTAGLELGHNGEPWLTFQLQVQGEMGQVQLKLETASNQGPIWSLDGSWQWLKAGLQVRLIGLQIQGAAVELDRAEVSWQPLNSLWKFQARWRPQNLKPWELSIEYLLLYWRLLAEAQLALDGRWSQGKLEAGHGPWGVGVHVAREGEVEGWLDIQAQLDQARTWGVNGRLVVGSSLKDIGGWSWKRAELRGRWHSPLGLSRAQGALLLGWKRWVLTLEGNHNGSLGFLRGRAKLGPQGLGDFLLIGSVFPSDTLALDSQLQRAGPLWLFNLSANLTLSEELSLECFSSWRSWPQLSWRWEQSSVWLKRLYLRTPEP